MIGEDDLIRSFCGLITAGSHSTAQASILAIRALHQNPEQLEILRNDTDLLIPAVNELLRYESTGKFMVRYAKEARQYGDKTIEPGDALFICVPAINMDSAVFNDPNTLAIGREDVKFSIAFGYGEHYCVGAHLARVELACTLKAFLEKAATDTRLIEDDIVWKPEDMIFRTVMSLPIDNTVKS